MLSTINSPKEVKTITVYPSLVEGFCNKYYRMGYRLISITPLSNIENWYTSYGTTTIDKTAVKNEVTQYILIFEK